MVSDELKRVTRATIERRLVFERAFFLGTMAAFLVALTVQVNGNPFADPLVYVLILVASIAGAGYDGAREAVKDLDLIAGFLELQGKGAQLERMPFFMKGHYEVWLTSPSVAGERRVGLSFANSLLGGDAKSQYLLMVPVPPGKHEQEPPPARKPFTETGTGGLLEGRTIEYFLWTPRRGGPKEWRVLAYLKPGRPIDVGVLVELASRAEAMAAKVAGEGVAAVPWGTAERFRPPSGDEIPTASRVALHDEPSE